MSLTDHVLIVFITLLLIYAIYDEYIMNIMKGKTLLRINLVRRNKIDCIIFVGLIAILIYNNILINSQYITHYLLYGLALMAIYISFIRWPKLLFKNTGFFYANTFIEYNRIKNMNLSEDGILLVNLERQRLLINVTQLDDLEKIYNFLIEVQQ